MTLDSDLASPAPSAGGPHQLTTELPAFAALRGRVSSALRASAAEIAARWQEQSRTVALRDESDVPPEAAAVPLVEALASALASEGTTSEDLVAHGLAFGADAFARGDSLHHALKGLDLLTAMLLYAAETSLAGETGATAADGARVSRRLQQAASLLTLAATKGYTQGMGDTMRRRFRHLRHDLRNPLGTIRSVLAMMDDETMPAEARAHPRFRAMAKRNARSLGELIADRLSDSAAVAPALVQQRASLRTIACGVRRDLRAEAESRGVTVTVGRARARVTVDAAGLELMLHELLLAALREASPGDELRVELGEVRSDRVDRATVTLFGAPERRPVAAPHALARLAKLAASMRGEIEAGERGLTLLVPMQRVEMTRVPDVPAAVPVAASADAAPAAAPAAASGRREPGHDVRGARERQHGQSRAL